VGAKNDIINNPTTMMAATFHRVKYVKAFCLTLTMLIFPLTF
jgi:hypothetical protein